MTSSSSPGPSASYTLPCDGAGEGSWESVVWGALASEGTFKSESKVVSVVSGGVTSLGGAGGLPKAKPTGFPMLPFPNENGFDMAVALPVPNPNPDGDEFVVFDLASPISAGFEGVRKDENPGVRGTVGADGLKLKGDEEVIFPCRAFCPWDVPSDVAVMLDSPEPVSSLTGGVEEPNGVANCADVCFSGEEEENFSLPNVKGREVLRDAGLSDVPVLADQSEGGSFSERSKSGVNPAP